MSKFSPRIAGKNVFLSLCLSAAVTVAWVGLAAAEDPSVAGRWKIIVTTGEGSRDYYIDLKHEGEKVAGVFESPRSGKYPFEGGSFSKGVLRIEVPRGERVFRIEAKLGDGGRFAGKLTINGEGGGEVTIEREAPPKPAPGKSPVAGKWNVVTRTADGNEYASQLEITESEKGIAGKSRSQLGEIAVKALSFEGKTLGFDLVLPLNGNDVPFEIRAELKDPNTLAGRWKTKEADFSGEWNAVREKPVAAEAPKAAPAAASPLSGAWFGVTSQGQDKHSFRLELEASGDRLAGKIHAGGQEHAVLDGRADGSKFQFAIEVGDEKQRIKVEGVVEGDLLKGRYATSNGDGGEWSARRPARL
jgi:predicted small integral membrane protein